MRLYLLLMLSQRQHFQVGSKCDTNIWLNHCFLLIDRAGSSWYVAKHAKINTYAGISSHYCCPLALAAAVRYYTLQAPFCCCTPVYLCIQSRLGSNISTFGLWQTRPFQNPCCNTFSTRVFAYSFTCLFNHKQSDIISSKKTCKKKNCVFQCDIL